MRIDELHTSRSKVSSYDTLNNLPKISGKVLLGDHSPDYYGLATTESVDNLSKNKLNNSFDVTDAGKIVRVGPDGKAILSELSAAAVPTAYSEYTVQDHLDALHLVTTTTLGRVPQDITNPSPRSSITFDPPRSVDITYARGGSYWNSDGTVHGAFNTPTDPPMFRYYYYDASNNMIDIPLPTMYAFDEYDGNTITFCTSDIIDLRNIGQWEIFNGIDLSNVSRSVVIVRASYESLGMTDAAEPAEDEVFMVMSPSTQAVPPTPFNQISATLQNINLPPYIIAQHDGYVYLSMDSSQYNSYSGTVTERVRQVLLNRVAGYAHYKLATPSRIATIGPLQFTCRAVHMSAPGDNAWIHIQYLAQSAPTKLIIGDLSTSDHASGISPVFEYSTDPATGIIGIKNHRYLFTRPSVSSDMYQIPSNTTYSDGSHAIGHRIYYALLPLNMFCIWGTTILYGNMTPAVWVHRQEISIAFAGYSIGQLGSDILQHLQKYVNQYDIGGDNPYWILDNAVTAVSTGSPTSPISAAIGIDIEHGTVYIIRTDSYSSFTSGRWRFNIRANIKL